MPLPQKKEQINRVTVKEHVYSTLKDWIIDGTMQPEESINDNDIAQYFSVSRTPVREALLLLAEQDFVEVVPSKGTRVSPLNRDVAVEVYEALSELNGSAAALACKKHSDAQIAKLRSLNEAFAKALKDSNYKKLSMLDNSFHEYLFAIAANSYLAEFAKELTDHAARYRNLYFAKSKDQNTSIEEHNDIIEAIATNNVEKAIKCAKQNWLGCFSVRVKKLF